MWRVKSKPAGGSCISTQTRSSKLRLRADGAFIDGRFGFPWKGALAELERGHKPVAQRRSRQRNVSGDGGSESFGMRGSSSTRVVSSLCTRKGWMRRPD